MPGKLKGLGSIHQCHTESKICRYVSIYIVWFVLVFKKKKISRGELVRWPCWYKSVGTQSRSSESALNP